MTHIDLKLYAEFIAVCEAGSFTAAAAQLNITKSILSEHISRLEQQLGVQLLHRTTRRLQVTESGQAVLNAARASLEQLSIAIQSIQEDHHSISGTIRLASAIDFATIRLSAQLAKFIERHPQIEIQFTASDEHQDLLGEQLDLTIRVGWLAESSHKARRIGQFKQLVVAAPHYLAQYGTLKHTEELAQHRWLTLNVLSNPQQWTFNQGKKKQTVKTNGSLYANSALITQTWAVAGAGITIVTDFQAQAELAAGRLVHVLSDWELPSGGIFAVYPATRHLPQRVRALIDFLAETDSDHHI